MSRSALISPSLRSRQLELQAEDPRPDPEGPAVLTEAESAAVAVAVQVGPPESDARLTSASDWEAGTQVPRHGAEALVESAYNPGLAVGVGETASCLAEVEAVFDRYLFLPDHRPLHMVLGFVAANLLPGDPVWLMLVAVPSAGKTEILLSLMGVPGVHPAATLTEGALLSGTSHKERARDAKGGLLRTIGDFGIILAKDFGSVLSMNRDTRAALLAALREIYDGSWTRHVGTDGGQTLSWQGKVGIIAGVTPAIDRHHEAIASLGNRFLLFRLADTEDAKQAEAALRSAGREQQMRREMNEAVRELFSRLSIPPEPILRSEEEIRVLSDLATFAAHARSSVERDNWHREIDLIPGAEAPARLAKALAQLLAGLRLIGLDEPSCWRLLEKTALDSMPAIRRRVLDVMTGVDKPLKTSEVAGLANYPPNTARRALEDLKIYSILQHAKLPGDGRDIDTWELTDWSRDKLKVVSRMSAAGGAMGE